MKRFSCLFWRLPSLLSFLVSPLSLQASPHDIRGSEEDLAPLVNVGLKRPSAAHPHPEDPDSRHKKPRYASPLVDSAFKQAMAIDGEHGSETVLSFLNTFVPDFRKDPVKEVTSQPLPVPVLPERNKKQTFLDFHVVTQSGERAAIEMQTKRHPRFDERSLFYLTAIHYDQLTSFKRTHQKKISPESLSSDKAIKVKKPPNQHYLEKDWYYGITKTYAIQILGYDSQKARGIDTFSSIDKKFTERVKAHPMKEGQYVKHFMMTDCYSGQTLDEIQMIQIELPRFMKPLFPAPEVLKDPKQLHAFYEGFDEEQWWLSVFRQSSSYDDSFMEALMKANVVLPKGIESLFNRLEYAQWNPDLRSTYEIQLKDLEDFRDQIESEKAESREEGLQEGLQQGLKEGEEKGRKEGEEKGRKEEKNQIALGMLTKGIDTPMISELTGLSEEEVRRLGARKE